MNGWDEDYGNRVLLATLILMVCATVNPAARTIDERDNPTLLAYRSDPTRSGRWGGESHSFCRSAPYFDLIGRVGVGGLCMMASSHASPSPSSSTTAVEIAAVSVP